MVAEQAESLVIGVRGEGGAGRARFLAPHFLAVGGVDRSASSPQHRDLLLQEATGQEQIAFSVELLELLER